MTQSPLGTSLTLSAFCPTAASLLFDDAPFSITQIEERSTRYDGMDAREVLPPLLRPGMLMDWDAVTRWEELAIGALSDHRDDVDTALQIIETASRDVCASWSPTDGSLSVALETAFMRSRESGVSSATALKDRRRDRSMARPHPAGADDMSDSKSDRDSVGPMLAPALARYLAGHALACWAMYDGRGIAGAVEHLRAVRATLNEESARLAAEAGRALDAVLLKEAFRQADVRLRHTVRS